jgi:polysaccharide pyruvyl transferase WcaK-like protein
MKKRRKRIGILTYFYVLNQGAQLQAYCLQELCKELNPDLDVEIINLKSLKKLDFYNSHLNFKRFLQSIKSKNSRKELFSFIKQYIQQHFFFKLSKTKIISDDYQESIRFINKLNYDQIIIGSDEVWKISKHKISQSFPNIYWGAMNLNAKISSFSASANNSDNQSLNKELAADLLKQFFKISVRDSYTQELVYELTDYKAPLTLDPVLLKKDIELMANYKPNKKIKCLANKNFALLLFRSPQKPSNKEKIIEFISLMKQRGLTVISLSTINFDKRIDVTINNFELTIQEWHYLLENAKLCFSAHLHPVIIRIRSQKPVITIKSPEPSTNKVGDLMKTFGMESLSLNENDNLDNSIIDQALNFDFTNTIKILEQRRKNDLEFLQELLK